METWSWILVYLVGFTVFQLLLFRYFSDDGSLGAGALSKEASAPGSLDRDDGGHDPGPGASAERDGDGDVVQCRQCGARNEDVGTYTYCRKCLAQLR